MTENLSLKISLESLGLTLSNPPSKFLLDKQHTENEEGPQSLQKSFVYVSNIDSEDSGSIVVLGKSSLDAIQADSLASYEQIRNKSLAMDCKSIISSLTPSQVEEKLAEVLRENLRLKETLEQNNMTMKRHLNNLVVRQNELAQVHEAHRRKFAETKNLVSVLKNENNEYRTKIDERNKEQAEQSTQTDEKSETEVSTETVENSAGTEMIELAEKCKQQNQEISHMRRIIESLKQQLESLYQNSFNSLKLEDLRSSIPPSSNDSSMSQRRQSFLESFTNYSEKLRMLGSCYAAQTSRYTSIQECLQRCSDIIATKCSGIEIPEDSEKSRKELQEHRARLIDEELSTIRERQEMIKSQNEFQRIFTDYNATLLEVESLRQEIERLGTLRNIANLHDSRLDEARANLRENEKTIASEKKRLARETVEMAREREKLAQERSRLEDQERKLVEENAALIEKVTTLGEDNAVLLQTYDFYQAEFKEEKKVQDTLLAERGELVEHIRKLDEEKQKYIREIHYLRTGETE